MTENRRNDKRNQRKYEYTKGNLDGADEAGGFFRAFKKARRKPGLGPDHEKPRNGDGGRYAPVPLRDAGGLLLPPPDEKHGRGCGAF